MSAWSLAYVWSVIRAAARRLRRGALCRGVVPSGVFSGIFICYYILRHAPLPALPSSEAASHARDDKRFCLFLQQADYETAPLG